MKSSLLLAGISAAFLLATSGGAQAGSLTIEGGPSFLPSSSFTDNDISSVLRHNPDGIMGDVVRLFGDSMVAPAVESPRILIGGDFEADAGDMFTVVYDFVVNLSTPDPITLTLGAQTTVQGVMQTFNTLIVLQPGTHQYSGQVTGPLFALATSGIWKGHLYFNFTSEGSNAGGGQTENPDPGNLLVQIRAVDYQLTAVPEPSSVALLAVGVVGLGLLARRRLA